MESSFEIHCQIASYANVLHSHILKTDEQIASLNSNITSFAQAQNIGDLNNTIVENLDDASQDAEEAVIAALERDRLSLIMEIQEQDFAQKKLKDMIDESSKLIHAVSQFYKDINANSVGEQTARRENDSSQPVLLRETKLLVRANISELKKKLSKLCDSIEQLVLQTQFDFLESPDAQEKLRTLVDALNEGFDFLLKVT